MKTATRMVKINLLEKHYSLLNNKDLFGGLWAGKDWP